uniref:Putative matrix protein n=1 Tax=Murine feces-associated rhabdovirus TaxID=2171387 RepID=A0A2S0SYX0_9RHAB|nr:putative matrix protein [Murine feces-associated rhabdovirus]
MSLEGLRKLFRPRKASRFIGSSMSLYSEDERVDDQNQSSTSSEKAEEGEKVMSTLWRIKLELTIFGLKSDASIRQIRSLIIEAMDEYPCFYSDSLWVKPTLQVLLMLIEFNEPMEHHCIEFSKVVQLYTDGPEFTGVDQPKLLSLRRIQTGKGGRAYPINITFSMTPAFRHGKGLYQILQERGYKESQIVEFLACPFHQNVRYYIKEGRLTFCAKAPTGRIQFLSQKSKMNKVMN